MQLRFQYTSSLRLLLIPYCRYHPYRLSPLQVHGREWHAGSRHGGDEIDPAREQRFTAAEAEAAEEAAARELAALVLEEGGDGASGLLARVTARATARNWSVFMDEFDLDPAEPGPEEQQREVRGAVCFGFCSQSLPHYLSRSPSLLPISLSFSLSVFPSLSAPPPAPRLSLPLLLCRPTLLPTPRCPSPLPAPRQACSRHKYRASRERTRARIRERGARIRIGCARAAGCTSLAWSPSNQTFPPPPHYAPTQAAAKSAEYPPPAPTAE